jgi:hypothetical protein
MDTTTTAITDEQIEALRDEANAAGDDLAASLCNSALRGNLDHRKACAVMIADAAAQDDGDDGPSDDWEPDLNGPDSYERAEMQCRAQRLK